MITGLGIDLVEISRMKRLKEQVKERIFTKNELCYAGNRAQTLAGIFAAKEALVKATGIGLLEALRHTELRHTEQGCPYFEWTDDLAKRLETVRLFVSITHDGGYAAAVVAAEQKTEKTGG